MEIFETRVKFINGVFVFEGKDAEAMCKIHDDVIEMEKRMAVDNYKQGLVDKVVEAITKSI